MLNNIKKKRPIDKAFLVVLATLLMVLTFLTISRTLESLDSNVVLRKDFLQDYLLVNATLDGKMPYEDISKLKKDYFPDDKTVVFNHPTPHPPTILPFLFPFAFFEYKLSAALWSLCAVLSLMGCSVLISRALKGKNYWSSSILVFLILLSSDPVRIELVSGQYSIFLLLFMLLLASAIENKRYISAGIFLGLSLSIKLFGSLALLFFIYKKKWKLVISTLVTFAILFTLSFFLLDWPTIKYYFLDVAPSIKDLYSTSEYNKSLLTIGNRIFLGTNSSVLEGAEIAPILFWPEAAAATTWIVVAVFLAVCAFFLSGCKNLVIGLALTILINIIVSPVSWMHSAIVAFCPIVILYSLTPMKGKFFNYLLGFISVVFYIGNMFKSLLIDSSQNYSFFEGLVTLLPLFNNLLLLSVCFMVVGKREST